MSRVRRVYGDRPLHLLASIIAFTIVAAGVAGWFQAGSDPRGILLWALGSALAFEWIVVPLAWLLDRIAAVSRHRDRPGHAPRAPRRAVAFIRVPGLLSLLLLLVFAPLVFRADTSDYRDTTGTAPTDYLARWLVATAALYVASALGYALTLRRAAVADPGRDDV